ncbi:MAG: radical SAM protein [Candidatus Omnitrophota bacterium]
MKIVFIEPHSSKVNVYSKIPMPLLGPVYLGTILKARGHEVEIYNEDIRPPDYRRLRADVIGLSLLTSTARRGYEIAGKFPKDKVIMGGVHPSLLPQEALAFARQVVTGEAEGVIADVIEGRIKDPIVRGAPVENLDLLPFPDFSLVKGLPPKPLLLPVSTSRGCPFDCSFCSVTLMFGRKYRFRDPANVMKELEGSRARRVFFCDDNFSANPRRTKILLELLSKSGIRNWVCQVRCDAARDPELLELMSRAGCELVCVGFESINPETLKAYQKNQTLEEIIRAIRSFHLKKIKIHGMFVLGGETDDRNTVLETVKFAVRQKIETIQLMILTPFPGTKVHETLQAQKRIFTKDWRFYDGQHIVFTPSRLSAKDLQTTVLHAYRKFYSLLHSFSLFLSLRFRDALFRLIGYRLLRQWMRQDRDMAWLKARAVTVSGAEIPGETR